MKAKRKSTRRARKPPTLGHPLEATVGTLGAISGAGLGALAAGPPGAIVGGIIGAAVGASTGWAADEQTVAESRANDALDETIGVTAGTVGAPNLQHPPPRVGAPSAEAAGIEEGTVTEAEGPLAPPPG